MASDQEPSFSFSTGVVSGWEPTESLAPPTIEPPKTGTLDYPDAASEGDTTGIDVAYKWSRLYARDVEFEDFFSWIDRRSNPERTDFKAILESIPLQWGPDQLPPPLRRHFMKMFTASGPGTRG